MNYTGIKKSRSMPLLPKLKKKIAYHKLKRGKPVSKFTKETKEELKDKKYLVKEAKRLMAITTPCADNAGTHNLTLDEVLEDILYDSDEYTEYKENIAVKALHEVINKSKIYNNVHENNVQENNVQENNVQENNVQENNVQENNVQENNVQENNVLEDSELDNCEMPNSNIEKNEKGSSPIHIHLLYNELEIDSNVICNDTSSDTSDTDYKEALKREDDNEIFRMDEELDIIDNDFKFIN